MAINSPDDDDVRLLSSATKDISEYLVDIAKKRRPRTVYHADGNICGPSFLVTHAHKIWAKKQQDCALDPRCRREVIERCSGHIGSWGMMKDNFETGLKIGRPSARKVIEKAPKYVVSECPLAGTHIIQGMERLWRKRAPPQIPEHAPHPLSLLQNLTVGPKTQ